MAAVEGGRGHSTAPGSFDTISGNGSDSVNARLDRLEPYPFEKLRRLLADVTPPPELAPIRLSIGEPQHETPELIRRALVEHLDGLSVYPMTAGLDSLRAAMTAWFKRRYGLPRLDAASEVLPVNGTREALFAFAQCVVDASHRTPAVVCPNPFYQIYGAQDVPPIGGLEAAHRLGRDDFRNLVVFTSLSKRSNAPGLRSGGVAGAARLLRSFLLYRTYHGCAMSPATQHASIAAWGDEAHVGDNRRKYQEKFAAVVPILEPDMPVARPDAGFYLWARVPHGRWSPSGAASDAGVGDDELFARELFAASHVTVLPGRYLAREAHGVNPGRGYVRMALVPELGDCVAAARRIVQFCRLH